MRAPASRISGAIVWRGPSRFDGSDIVAIVTGLGARPSANRKTGAMAQVWILRADMSPMDAITRGLDRSVCNDCKHGSVAVPDVATTTYKKGSCYVDVGKAPQAIWRKFARGGYPTISPRDAADLARARGLRMRLGAYGDPSALPVDVLYGVTVGVNWTGYTHSWKTSADYRPYLMASVDTPAEYEQAQAAGWRAFRVKLASEPLTADETVCPASDEAGRRSTCSACRLCSGTRPEDTRRSIAINVHGSGAARYIALRAVA